MKKITHLLKTIKLSFLLLLFLLSSSISFCQTAFDMDFKNPVLESGIAGQNGAKYRFSNVTLNLDAVVEIIGRSADEVTLSNIDTSGPGLGYDFAFQPVIGIPGTVPANSNWSMDFKLTFYQAGTTTIVNSPLFKATGIDIDGDGLTLSEWATMKNVTSVDSTSINNLTFTKSGSTLEGDDYKVEGIIANSPGIDTSAKNVSATYTYIDKGEIYFTIGAKTSASETSAGMRLNSIWFTDFHFSSTSLLPIHLISFQGNLSKNNKVTLNWIITDNETVKNFEIERSINGKDFATTGVAFLSEKTGTENYVFYETINSNDKAIYRLKITGKNHEINYSKLLVFQAKALNNNTIRIIGNPVNDKLTFSYSSPATQIVDVKVYDMSGRVVVSNKVNSLEGSNVISLPLSSTFKAGMYVVEVNNGTELQSSKFVKQ